MIVKLHFDGEKILVPDELRGHAPVDLEATIVETSSAMGGSKASWLDEFIGSIKRTPDEVDDWLREIRAARDEE